jgi:ABC-type Na+ efflux pump permease subunit
MISMALLFSYGVFGKLGMGEGSPMSGVHIPVSLVLYAVVHFFGGYFLYSSMFAAIGAACSNEQDAQQLQWLAMARLVYCMLIYRVVLSDPTSTISVVLSEIPFFSPVLIPLRVSLQTLPPMADRSFPGAAILSHRRHCLRFRKNLSYWNIDARQASVACRDVPLAPLFSACRENGMD